MYLDCFNNMNKPTFTYYIVVIFRYLLYDSGLDLIKLNVDLITSSIYFTLRTLLLYCKLTI